MHSVGIVKSVRFGKGYRSEKDVVIVECVIDDDRDIQSIEYLFEAGSSFVPFSGDTVLIHEVSSEYKVATSVNSGVVVSSLSSGEKAVFAYSDGDVKSIIEFLNSGELVLNRGEGYAVEFERLKAGIDSLVEYINGHTHAFTGLDAGVIGTTGTVTVESVDSIDDSKVDLVRI